MNYRMLLLSISLTAFCGTTIAISQQPWRCYILPCKHGEDGTLQCLVTKKNNVAAFIKNNFTGDIMLPGTTNEINFDAIRANAHGEIQRIGFPKTDYIYAVGEANQNRRRILHVFLIDPTKKISLKNPPESELTWEDLAILPALGLGQPSINDIQNGLQKRYQRKIIYVDWDDAAGTGFVKQADRVIPQIVYEPTMYALKSNSKNRYPLTSTEIRPVGIDNTVIPEDDTAFERYDIALAPTPAAPETLLFPTKDPEGAKKFMSNWSPKESMELAQRILNTVGQRAIALLTESLYKLANT